MPAFLELCKTAIDDNDLPRLTQLFQALQQANKALYRLVDSETKGRIYLHHSQDVLCTLLEHAARKNNFAMVKVLSDSGASEYVKAKVLANIVVQERPNVISQDLEREQRDELSSGFAYAILLHLTEATSTYQSSQVPIHENNLITELRKIVEIKQALTNSSFNEASISKLKELIKQSYKDSHYKCFSIFINQITSGQMDNPFTENQWNLLYEVLSRVNEHPFRDLKSVTSYQYPSRNSNNYEVKATIDTLPKVDSVSKRLAGTALTNLSIHITTNNVYERIPLLVNSILEAKKYLEKIGVTDFDELSIFRKNPVSYDPDNEVDREKLMMILTLYTNDTKRFKQILRLPGLDRHHFESAFDVLAEQEKHNMELLEWVYSQHQKLSPFVARLWRGGAWLEYILKKYNPEELLVTQWRTFRLRDIQSCVMLSLAQLRYHRNTKYGALYKEHNGTALQVVAATGTPDDLKKVIKQLESVDQQQVEKAIVDAYAYANSKDNLECLLKLYSPAEQNKAVALSNALYRAIQIQNTDGAMVLLEQGARIIPSTRQQATKWKNGLIKTSKLTLNTKLSDEFFTQLFKMHCNCDNQEIIAIIAELAYMHDNTELLKKLFDHPDFSPENIFTSNTPENNSHSSKCLGMLLFKYGLDTFQKKPGFNVLYEQGIKRENSGCFAYNASLTLCNPEAVNKQLLKQEFDSQLLLINQCLSLNTNYDKLLPPNLKSKVDAAIPLIIASRELRERTLFGIFIHKRNIQERVTQLLQQSIDNDPTFLAQHINSIVIRTSRNPYTKSQWNCLKAAVKALCSTADPKENILFKQQLYGEALNKYQFQVGGRRNIAANLDAMRKVDNNDFSAKTNEFHKSPPAATVSGRAQPSAPVQQSQQYQGLPPSYLEAKGSVKVIPASSEDQANPDQWATTNTVYRDPPPSYEYTTELLRSAAQSMRGSSTVNTERQSQESTASTVDKQPPSRDVHIDYAEASTTDVVPPTQVPDQQPSTTHRSSVSSSRTADTDNSVADTSTNSDLMLAQLDALIAPSDKLPEPQRKAAESSKKISATPCSAPQ